MMKEVTREISLDGLNVYVGIPAGRDLPVLTVKSILASQEKCLRMGIPFSIGMIANSAVIQWARDEVVNLFMQTNANRLFLIDSDMIWEADDFMRMLAMSQVADVVCATYTLKTDPPTFCVYRDDNVEMITDDYGLLDIWGVGLGFTVIKREVIEKLYNNAPKIHDEITKRDIPQIFRVGQIDGKRQGEDMAFFEDIRNLGYKIKLDPSVNLGHIGKKVFNGSIMDALKIKDV